MEKKTAEHSEMQAIRYVRDHKAYELLGTIGSVEDYAAMYEARYAPNSEEEEEETVEINIFDLDRVEDIYNLTNQVYTARQCCHHQNIQGVYCSFMVENKLWVVMPLISRVSIKSMMLSSLIRRHGLRQRVVAFGFKLMSSFRHGLVEQVVAFVLKETLKALDCIHGHGDHVHGNVDSDHVFVDKNLNVKLGFHSLTNKIRVLEETPSWMIDPELTTNLNKAHNQKSDIWMFGLFALDLFYDHEDLEFLAASLIEPKNYEAKFGRKKKLPESLRELVVLCLSRDPLKRPSTRELLNHKFFKGYCSSNFHVQKVWRKLFKEE